MESIKELRKICEKKHKKGVSQPNLYATIFIRKISIYLTWLLLHTSISANKVTLFQLVVTLIGSLLIVPVNIYINITGIFLIQLGYVLDNVDGEIARYRKNPTVNGLYIDLFNHLVMIPAMFYCLGFHYFFASDRNYIFIIAASLGALSLLNPTKRAIWAAIYYMTEKCGTPSYDYEHLKAKNKGATPPNKSKIGLGRFSNLYKKLNHLIFSYPNYMNWLSLIILMEIIFPKNVSMLYFIIYLSMSVYQIVRELLGFIITVKEGRAEEQFIQMINNLRKSKII